MYFTRNQKLTFDDTYTSAVHEFTPEIYPDTWAIKCFDNSDYCVAGSHNYFKAFRFLFSNFPSSDHVEYTMPDYIRNIAI